MKNQIYYLNAQKQLKSIEIEPENGFYTKQLPRDKYDEFQVKVVNQKTLIAFSSDELLLFKDVTLPDECSYIDLKDFRMTDFAQCPQSGLLVLLSDEGQIALVNLAGKVLNVKSVNQRKFDLSDFGFIFSLDQCLLLLSRDGQAFSVNVLSQQSLDINKVQVIQSNDFELSFGSVDLIPVQHEDLNVNFIVASSDSGDNLIHFGLYSEGEIIFYQQVLFESSSILGLKISDQNQIIVFATNGIYLMQYDFLKVLVNILQSDSIEVEDLNGVSLLRYLVKLDIPDFKDGHIFSDSIGLQYAQYTCSASYGILRIPSYNSNPLEIQVKDEKSDFKDATLQQNPSILQQNKIIHQNLEKLSITSPSKTIIDKANKYPDQLDENVHEIYTKATTNLLDDVQSLLNGIKYLKQRSNLLTTEKLRVIGDYEGTKIDLNSDDLYERFQFLIQNQKRLTQRTNIMLSLLMELQQPELSSAESQWIQKVFQYQSQVKSMDKKIQILTNDIKNAIINNFQSQDSQQESQINERQIDRIASLVNIEEDIFADLKERLNNLQIKVNALSYVQNEQNQ